MNLAAIRAEVLAKGFDPIVFSPARVNQFINDGQAKIARRVNYYTDQATQTIATTSGKIVYTLPSKLAQIQDVFDSDLGNTLDYAELKAMDNSDPNSTGRPAWYTVLGSTLRLYPQPDTVYNLTVRYWALPADLVNDTDVPVMPADFHHLLVEYAVAEAFDSEDDPQNGQAWRQKFTTGVSEFSAAVKFPAESPTQVRGMWDVDPVLTTRTPL